MILTIFFGFVGQWIVSEYLKTMPMYRYACAPWPGRRVRLGTICDYIKSSSVGLGKRRREKEEGRLRNL
jgi:hypothetical protein